MAEHFVCNVDELVDGSVKILKHEAVEVGVFLHGGEYFAYRNLCPHQGGPACEGVRMPQVQDVIDDAGLFVGQRFDEDDMHIVCPWHGYEYHLKSGEHVCDQRLKLRSYKVTSRDGGVYVDI